MISPISERIFVKERFSVERHAAQDTIVQAALDLVGIAGITIYHSGATAPYLEWAQTPAGSIGRTTLNVV
jgi:hypothetical protein